MFQDLSLKITREQYGKNWQTGFVCNRELNTLLLVPHKAVLGTMATSLICGAYCCCYCLQWHPVLFSKFLPIHSIQNLF